VACLAVNVLPVSAVGPGEADAAVADADGALRGAFVAASDAESVGANVSGLMGRLTEAGAALTGAKVALASGNYSHAVSWAGTCKALAEGVSGDAGVLKSDSVARAAGWWLAVSFGVVGAAVFVAVLFLVWRWFRRVYGGKLLESRPEVAV